MQESDVPFLAKLADNVCLSGGAAGADITWGNEASSVGHQVIHWSFEGHKSQDPSNTYLLTDEELHEADDFLKEANLTLKRRLDFKKFYIKLLQRNWYQIKYADAVYAVGTLNEKASIYEPKNGFDPKYHITNDRKDRLGINGGTAWACQMYLDRYRKEANTMNFLLLFYDQDKKDVFFYSPSRGSWIPLHYRAKNILGHTIEEFRPAGIYAAIGTRDLKPNGAEFIKDLFTCR